MPFAEAGETAARVVESSVSNEGYKVDSVKDRVAMDLEWSAKDGNLDRDLAAYRALYDAGLIDGAVLVTRTVDDLRALGYRIRLAAGMDEKSAKNVLSTSTTTNTKKLIPRLQRGDAGGCPVLAAAICGRTWEGWRTERDGTTKDLIWHIRSLIVAWRRDFRDGDSPQDGGRATPLAAHRWRLQDHSG
jgi:hypothetical protein